MENIEKDFLGVGISQNLTWIKYEEAIQESIIVILSTSPGERVMRPDFGAGINRVVMSTTDSYSIGVMKENIKTSLLKWEPRINNIIVSVKMNSAEARLDIDIAYTIIKANKRANLVYPFYLEGEPK